MSAEHERERLSRGPPHNHNEVPSDRKACRILIVEDDALIAMDAEHALREAGYDVVGIASRCADALGMVAAGLPDLIVMDIRLAGERDGVEAALIIRRAHDIPSLFATAQTEPELAQRAEPVEPAGWLRKPYEGHQLVNAVDAALGHGR